MKNKVLRFSKYVKEEYKSEDDFQLAQDRHFDELERETYSGYSDNKSTLDLEKEDNLNVQWTSPTCYIYKGVKVCVDLVTKKHKITELEVPSYSITDTMNYIDGLGLAKNESKSFKRRR